MYVLLTMLTLLEILVKVGSFYISRIADWWYIVVDENMECGGMGSLEIISSVYAKAAGSLFPFFIILNLPHGKIHKCQKPKSVYRKGFCSSNSSR